MKLLKSLAVFATLLFALMIQVLPAQAQELCSGVYLPDANTKIRRKIELDHSRDLQTKLTNGLGDSKWSNILSEIEFTDFSQTATAHLNGQLYSNKSAKHPSLKGARKLLANTENIELTRIHKLLFGEKLELTAQVKEKVDEALRLFAEEAAKDENNIQFAHDVARLTQSLLKTEFAQDRTKAVTLLLGSALLADRGILSPRLIDANRALTMSTADWVQEYRLAIEDHALMVKDLQNRADTGLKIEDSPYLMWPRIPGQIEIKAKIQRNKAVVESTEMLTVDPAQVRAFVETKLGIFAEPSATLAKVPLEKIESAIQEYQAFFLRNNYLFAHARFGNENIHLNLIDRDFYSTWRKGNATNAKLYRLRRDRFYYKDQIIWRGWSHRNRVFTDLELVGRFMDLAVHSMGNSTYKKFAENKSMSDAYVQAEANFRKFNEDMLNGTVWEVAEKHQKMIEGYQDGYGLSTSKDWTVARGFAMGAMKVADYGKQQEFQDQLKERLVMGYMRGEKDLDMTRLHQFYPRFIYKYFRQKEVMGVGAIDADSVVFVQRLNPDKTIKETFYRDPEQPWLIYKIEGDWNPVRLGTTKPKDLKVLQTFDLREIYP